MHIYKSFVDECIYILKLLIISISTFSTTNNKTITIEEREGKKMQPKREILSMMDMGKWKKSKVWSIFIRLHVN